MQWFERRPSSNQGDWIQLQTGRVAKDLQHLPTFCHPHDRLFQLQDVVDHPGLSRVWSDCNLGHCCRSTCPVRSIRPSLCSSLFSTKSGIQAKYLIHACCILHLKCNKPLHMSSPNISSDLMICSSALVLPSFWQLSLWEAILQMLDVGHWIRFSSLNITHFCSTAAQFRVLSHQTLPEKVVCFTWPLLSLNGLSSSYRCIFGIKAYPSTLLQALGFC